MKVIAYMRVSKQQGMTVENQRLVIENWIALHKHEIEDILWLDESISTRKDRPKQQEAYKLIMSGAYSTLVAVRLDRWGRSLIELVNTVNDMVAKDARVIFLNNGLDFKKDTFDAMSKLQLHIISSFAEYERDLIRERTMEGLERAKSEGKKLGRKHGSKDKKPRRRSGYWLRWQKEHENK